MDDAAVERAAKAWLDELCVEVLEEPEPFHHRDADEDARSLLAALAAAVPEKDEDGIERVAKALMDNGQGDGAWDDAESEALRDSYRREAEVALSAAAVPPTEDDYKAMSAARQKWLDTPHTGIEFYEGWLACRRHLAAVPPVPEDEKR